jgi:hypothetical protein
MTPWLTQEKREWYEMIEIQQLQALAVARGFQKMGVAGDGTSLWLWSTGPGASGMSMRMCIDAVTQSATVYWEEEKAPTTKTCRKAQEMQVWLDWASRQ